jgi:hypothetical protein
MPKEPASAWYLPPPFPGSDEKQRYLGNSKFTNANLTKNGIKPDKASKSLTISRQGAKTTLKVSKRLVSHAHPLKVG